MKKISRWLLVCCAVLIVTQCSISWGKSIRLEPETELVSVEIIGDDRGRLTPEYKVRGDALSIEARRDERFSIRVINRSESRIALAISVDGRNIISGEKSYNRPGESMYVLAPQQTGNFSGWRSSYDKVQRFYFTPTGDSYASRMGDSSQVGWIKVAVFREKYYYQQPKYYGDEMPLSRSAKKPTESNAGTGYGEGSYSPVSSTEFSAESFAAQVVNIRYNWPVNVIIEKFAPSPY